MGERLTELQALDIWRRTIVNSVRLDGPDLSARQMAILLTVYMEAGPHTVRGLVMSEDGNRTLAARAKRRLAMWSARPDFLACDVRDLPSRFVAAQRARGVPVASWTVRSADEAARVARYADAPIFEVGAAQD